MSKIYKQVDFDNLYEISNKYWETGYPWLLDSVFCCADKIGMPYRQRDISNLFDFIAKEHLSKETAKQILKLFGFKCQNQTFDSVYKEIRNMFDEILGEKDESNISN